MDKVIVKIYFPIAEEIYDVWIPLNQSIYKVIVMLVKGINELNNDEYIQDSIPILYNKTTGLSYNVNDLIKNTDIRNGTELILI